MSSPSSSCLWKTAPPKVPLDAGEVHLWRIPLDRPEARCTVLEALLSSEEVARAGRFVRQRDQRRFVVARGSLRQALARYLEADSADLQFCYGERGKPYLAGHPLHFNLSHSGELAVLAVSRSAAIGVDVEELRSFDNAQNIAHRFFTERETTALRSLRGRDVDTAFFHLWTCKEAYLKATGKGLAKPLNEVEVSLPPGPDARFLAVGGSRDELTRWLLKIFVPRQGYVAAWVLDGSAERVLFLELES